MKFLFIFFIIYYPWLELYPQSPNLKKYDNIWGPCTWGNFCDDNYYIVQKGAKKNVKFALLDSNMVEISKYNYQEIELCTDYCGVMYNEGFLRVKRTNKWGYLNELGEEVIKCEFDSVGYFKDGIAVVRMNKKYGVINKLGKYIINNSFDYPLEIREEKIIFRGENNKKRLFLPNGNIVVNCIYDDFLGYYKNNNQKFQLAQKDLKFGWLNEKGEEVIQFKYEDAKQFFDGFSCVKENGKWGIIDLKGDYVIINLFDSIFQINNSEHGYNAENRYLNWFAIVLISGNKIFINDKGIKIKDCPFEQVEPFSYGLAAVSNEKELFGFIDSTLTLIIPQIYSWIPDIHFSAWRYPPKFSGDYCSVNKNEKFSIINKSGDVITIWSEIYFEIPGENSYSEIMINKKYGLLNGKFKLQIPAIYDHLNLIPFRSEFYGSLPYFIPGEAIFPVVKGGCYGYIDIKGQTIIPFIYDDANPFQEGKAKVKQNGLEYFIDISGKKI